VPSPDRSFEELRQRLRLGHSLNQASDDPVYYLIFRPEEMLEVKRRLKSWQVKLSQDNYKVHLFSMAAAIREILGSHDLRDIWLESERDAPFYFEAINKTLTDALTSHDALKTRLEAKLASLSPANRDLLIITDTEALHPYIRVGSLEQRLQGKFRVPTIILYPGIRSGRTTLRFLGIYPEDGNYRSTHIGG